MLDTSIPYIGVLMEKEDPENFPRFKLPPGYTFSKYQDGFDVAWSQLQYDLHQTDSLEEAKTIFNDVFASQPDDLWKKCLFVLDQDGVVVGTASLWDGYHFGVKHQRIHWVAVAQSCNGKGIAKALLSQVFEMYHEMGFKDYIYLTSQTYSYKALGLYMQFGFKPYQGVKPMRWKSDHFEVENEVAWKLIYEKLTK